LTEARSGFREPAGLRTFRGMHSANDSATNHPDRNTHGLRRIWLIAGAAALLHIVLGFGVMLPAPFSGGDNATYVALAHSLLERGDYTSIWDPALTPETLYPPAFPAILAASIALGGDGWIAFKALLIVISAIGVACSVLWAARVSTPVVAAVIGVVIAISPGVLRHTHYVLSDVPFFAFTLIAFWAFTFIDAKESRRSDTKWVVVAALATLLAAMTRSAGLPLVLALGGALVVRRQWRHVAIFATLAAAPMLAWSLRSRSLNPNGYSSYLLWADPYRPELGRIGIFQLIPRALENARQYLLDMFPQLLVSRVGVPWGIAVLLLLLAVAVWLVRMVRRPGALETWVLLYTGILLIWPVTWRSERYLIVLLPAILFYAAEAFRQLTRVQPSLGRAVAVVATLALVLSELPGLRDGIRYADSCRDEYAAGDAFSCTPSTWKAIMQTAAELRGRMPADAVVLSRKPTLFFVLSGYRSRVYPMSADPAVFFAEAKSATADYLLLDDSDLSEQYVQPVLRSQPDNFCVITEVGRDGGRLLRIEPEATRTVPQPRDSVDVVRFATCPLTPSPVP